MDTEDKGRNPGDSEKIDKTLPQGRDQGKDLGPTRYTIAGQDAETGRKPEDKQSAVEQWADDDVKLPRQSDPS